MGHEAHDDEDDHDDALAQKDRVLDLLALVEARERVFVRVVDMELSAEEQVEQGEHHGEREQRRRGVVDDEVDE